MVKIEISDRVAHAMKLPDKELENSLKKILAVRLYDKGILGMGKARELAGVTRLEFQKLLKDEGVCINYDSEELEHDVNQLKELGLRRCH